MKKHQPAFAVGLAVAIIAAVQAHAAGSLPPSAHRMDGSSPACETARLSAWFERQRQLTDGDVDPQKPIAAPAECLRTADSGAGGQRHALSADTHDRAALPAPVPNGRRG